MIVRIEIIKQLKYINTMLYYIGKLLQNKKFFRNSRFGHKWACKYHPDVDGMDEYLLWQAGLI